MIVLMTHTSSATDSAHSKVFHVCVFTFFLHEGFMPKLSTVTFCEDLLFLFQPYSLTY